MLPISLGVLDPADYRQPIMTLLFLKRLNDTFEENAENLIQANKMRNKRYVKEEQLVLKVRKPCNRNKNNDGRRRKGKFS